jgi:hypothetical protein
MNVYYNRITIIYCFYYSLQKSFPTAFFLGNLEVNDVYTMELLRCTMIIGVYVYSSTEL